MTKQQARCPHCNKRLCDVTLIGDVVIVEAFCKNCGKIVDVVVKRQEGASRP